MRDSDGTAVISLSDRLRTGSLATFGLAREMGKPVVWLSSPEAGRNAAKLREFVKTNQVKILNVAGPRQSQESGIYDVTMEILRRAFG